MSAHSWEKDILWYKAPSAGGSWRNWWTKKLHGWKHPAFSEVSGYGFLTDLSFYNPKTTTSAALAFCLGILVLLLCGISSKRAFLHSCPEHSCNLQIPATCCRDDSDHPQVAEEQSDPSRMAVQHSWLHQCGHFLHSLPSVLLTQAVYHLEESTCAGVALG